MESSIKPAYFPDFPDDLSIGRPLTGREGGAYFEGDIKREEDQVKNILPGPASAALHERGIRISNRYYENLMDIHFSQLIDLRRIEDEVMVEKERPFILEVLFALLVVLTMGILLAAATGMLSESRRHGGTALAPFLVIHFWDVGTKTEKKIQISGRSHKIEKFIRRQLAALNS